MIVSSAASADLVIIGHPDIDTGSLDTLSVKRLFLGERKAFPNGLHATPINHAEGSPDRKEFFSSVLSMAESSHKRHWKRKTSTGGGYSPTELNSHDEVLQEIANTPGSISYIDSSLVDDSVKVLLTINDFDDV
jgi:ABC-type phosphate transport system substrate-binding protein